MHTVASTHLFPHCYAHPCSVPLGPNVNGFSVAMGDVVSCMHARSSTGKNMTLVVSSSSLQDLIGVISTCFLTHFLHTAFSSLVCKFMFYINLLYMAFLTDVRYYFFVIPKADFVKFPYLHFFLELFLQS